ncbi:DegT/DnrJ/EryC1/StrS family aminotransferase [Rhodovulum sp. YNF3179]|uniref:DegT/DnrJ/EryC1/StrS family aminotransferase n=1 Tax=Rhodovulum sp. YNF3179 TaxID=3425127 RepID=UPI003D325512
MRIYLSRPHMSGHEQAHLARAFASGFVAPAGPQLDAFEDAVAEYLGPGLHCVALSSGSAALHLALRIAGVGPDDEVWVSSMTFAGGVFPILYQGATPMFFDLAPATWTMDAKLVEDALARAQAENRLPKAIVPTDLYGQSVDLNRFEALAAAYGVSLIVDSAESFGAFYRETRKAGSGGDAAILSFNGNKIITTSGGGMLVTRHEDWARQARFLATQARDQAPHYEHSTYGYNYRLSNISAAVGLGQMEILEERVARRRRVFERYHEQLAPLGVSFMPEAEGDRATRWLTVAVIDPERCGVDREKIRRHLLDHEIEARPVWKPMHLQPLFEGAGYVGAGFDEGLFENGLCLPSGSDMTDAEQDEVIGLISHLIERA